MSKTQYLMMFGGLLALGLSAGEGASIGVSTERALPVRWSTPEIVNGASGPILKPSVPVAFQPQLLGAGVAVTRISSAPPLPRVVEGMYWVHFDDGARIRVRINDQLTINGVRLRVAEEANGRLTLRNRQTGEEEQFAINNDGVVVKPDHGEARDVLKAAVLQRAVHRYLERGEPAREEALQLLMRAEDQGVPYVAAVLERADPQRRRRLVVLLAKIASPEAERLLLTVAVNDRSQKVRRLAAKALHNRHGETVRAAIVSLAGEASSRTGRRLASVLSSVGDRYYVDDLIDHLGTLANGGIPGRHRSRLASVLKLVTGMNFGTRVDKWRDWLQANADVLKQR